MSYSLKPLPGESDEERCARLAAKLERLKELLNLHGLAPQQRRTLDDEITQLHSELMVIPGKKYLH